MTIRYVSGDMFNCSADAIVNTVNCVGVMGKGIALQFKKRWPQNYTAYKKVCENELLSPGKMFVFDNSNMFDQDDFKFLINFPTKQHWRSKSKIEYVEDGLSDLVKAIGRLGIKSIVVPPLGCGNGGLEWSMVRPLIEQHLSALDGVDVFLFSPSLQVDRPEYVQPDLPMTLPRAALFELMGRFEPYFGGGFTRLSIQKLVYFLQVFDVQFGVKFERNIYGPYSADLARALVSMSQKSAILDYSNDQGTIRVSQGAFAAASEYLGENYSKTVDDAIEKTSLLIAGYESPFGLELLSSLHYLSVQNSTFEFDKLYNELCDWSERKKNLFSRSDAAAAFSRLTDDGLIVSP